MIEPRIYRAGFVPLLFVIVLVAFSLVPAPGPLPQGTTANAPFDPNAALSSASQIARAQPDRRPGGAGDAALAQQVAGSLAADGFRTTSDRFKARETPLVNVVARRPGSGTREIVVVAARDTRSVTAAPASAADTAALLQLGGIFKGSASRHTLVLASIDGQSLGGAGATRLAGELGDPSQIDGVIAISNLAAGRSRGPLVLSWSDASQRGNLSLHRTAVASLTQELGPPPGDEPTLAQFARLAFPIAPGIQGPLLSRGFPAVRFSGSGELDPAGWQASSPARYGSLAGGALRLVSALDATDSPPAHGPPTYLNVSGQILPGWAIRALAVALLFPAFVTAVDALARASRRREHIGGWLRWLLGAVLAFAIGLAAGKLVAYAGLAPVPIAAPPDPSAAPLDLRAAGTLATTIAMTALGWLVVRRALIRSAGPLPPSSAPGAGCAIAAVLAVAGMACAFVNPFAAVIAAPAIHLWMLCTTVELPPRRAAAIAIAGVLPFVALAAYYLWRLAVDPIHGAYYLYLLIVGGPVGLAATLMLCILLGAGASVAAILLARLRTEAVAAADRARQPILGPGGHAGPGALGSSAGSALRR